MRFFRRRNVSIVFEFDPNCDQRSVFALKVDAPITPEIADRMRRAWDAAWTGPEGTPPKLLIFERGMELSSLTDDQLRRAGLMRIEFRRGLRREDPQAYQRP